METISDIKEYIYDISSEVISFYFFLDYINLHESDLSSSQTFNFHIRNVDFFGNQLSRC